MNISDFEQLLGDNLDTIKSALGDNYNILTSCVGTDDCLLNVDGKYVEKSTITTVIEDGWLDESKGVIDISKVKDVKLANQIKLMQDALANKDVEKLEEVNKIKIDYAVANTLQSFGAKNVGICKAHLKLDDVKVDDDGKVIGVDEAVKALVAEADFLFADDAGHNSPNRGSEPDFANMTAAELFDYQMNNPD